MGIRNIDDLKNETPAEPTPAPTPPDTPPTPAPAPSEPSAPPSESNTHAGTPSTPIDNVAAQEESDSDE